MIRVYDCPSQELLPNHNLLSRYYGQFKESSKRYHQISLLIMPVWSSIWQKASKRAGVESKKQERKIYHKMFKMPSQSLPLGLNPYFFPLP